ncbi:MAG: O-antigen polymerase [Verrucomicrobiota bacterium]
MNENRARRTPVVDVSKESAKQGVFPELGIAGAILGTILGFATIPEDTTPADSLRLSALLMSGCFALAPLRAALSHPRNVLRTENIIGLAPIYWLLLDLIQGVSSYEDASRPAISTTFLLVGTFTTMYWIGCLGSPPKLPKTFVQSANIRFPTSVLFTILVILFTLGMLRYALPCGFNPILMIEALGMPRFATPWSGSRFGGVSAILDHLSYFGYLLPALTVMLARRIGWMKGAVWVGIVFSLIFLAFVAQGGGRRIIGVMLGAALCFWLLDQKTIKIRHLLVAAACGVLILFVMQVMLVIRESGFSKIGADAIVAAIPGWGDDTVTTGSGTDSFIRVDDNFNRLAMITDIVPEEHPYVHHQFVFYTLVRPIPRFLWPGKPEDGGFDLATYLHADATLSSSIIGELYISFGWITVALGGWIFGRFATMPSQLLDSPQGTVAPMLYGWITMTLLVGMRSMVEVILFSYALLAWMLIAIGIQWLRQPPTPPKRSLRSAPNGRQLPSRPSR